MELQTKEKIKKSKSVSKPGDDIHGEGEGDDGVRGQHLHQHWQKITSTNFTELKTGQEAGHEHTGSGNFIANTLLRTDTDKSVGVKSLVRKFEELGQHQDDRKLKLNLVPAKKFYFGGIMGLEETLCSPSKRRRLGSSPPGPQTLPTSSAQPPCSPAPPPGCPGPRGRRIMLQKSCHSPLTERGNRRRRRPDQGTPPRLSDRTWTCSPSRKGTTPPTQPSLGRTGSSLMSTLRSEGDPDFPLKLGLERERGPPPECATTTAT